MEKPTTADNKNDQKKVEIPIRIHSPAEETVIMLGDAVRYNEYMLRRYALNASSVVNQLTEIFSIKEPIGMIPSGTVKPLLKEAKWLTAQMNELYKNIISDAKVTLSYNRDYLKGAYLKNNGAEIDMDLTAAEINYHKRQLKEVKEYLIPSVLDGKMTPEQYNKKAMTKKERKKLKEDTKDLIKTQVERKQEEIKTNKHTQKNFEKSEIEVNISSTFRVLNDFEVSKGIVNRLVAESRLFSGILNFSAVSFLENRLNAYSEMLDKQYENRETLTFWGRHDLKKIKTTVELLDSYVNNLKYMLRSEKPKASNPPDKKEEVKEQPGQEGQKVQIVPNEPVQSKNPAESNTGKGSEGPKQ